MEPLLCVWEVPVVISIQSLANLTVSPLVLTLPLQANAKLGHIFFCIRSINSLVLLFSIIQFKLVTAVVQINHKCMSTDHQDIRNFKEMVEILCIANEKGWCILKEQKLLER